MVDTVVISCVNLYILDQAYFNILKSKGQIKFHVSPYFKSNLKNIEDIYS
jgi:hypothetical protein